MATLADDFAAYQSAVANVAPLQAAAQSADAALAAGQDLVTSTAATVAAAVKADGPGFIGPDASGDVTVLESSTTPLGFSAQVIPPASSLAG